MSHARYSKTMGVIRVYSDAKSYENKDEYEGVVSVMWPSDTHAFLFGANGNTSKMGFVGVLRELKRCGAKKVTMSRVNGKVIPFGRLVSQGDVESLWEIDLNKLNIGKK